MFMCELFSLLADKQQLSNDMHTLFGAPIMDEQQLYNDQYQFEAKMLDLLDSMTNWRRREQGQDVRKKSLC